MTVRQRALARMITAGLLLVIAATLAVGCGSSNPQNTLSPSGDAARDINDLFVPIAWIAVAIFVLVAGVLLYILVRFRHREGPLPKQVHGNTRLEIAWTIAPTLLLAVIAVPTIATVFHLADTPANAMEVRVVANQWWWAFEYADSGVVTADEMHIPVGRPIRVTLESNDVIHSFWVPKLAGKTDVVPNHKNTMWFNATEPGTYSGQCAEFCGVSHGIMRFRVVAEPEKDFNAWLDAQKQPGVKSSDPQAQKGAAKFAATCSACHTVAGTDAAGKLGPNLTHFGSRQTVVGGLFERTDENVARWLRNPPDVKPGSKMPNYNLTDDEIAALTAYLNSLK